MALDFGNDAATYGMSKAIYDAMRGVMEEPIEDLEEDAKDAIREGWRKLAFAIAQGVVAHISEEAEVYNVTTLGDIEAEVVGTTATQENVAFTQDATMPGRVR